MPAVTNRHHIMLPLWVPRWLQDLGAALSHSWHLPQWLGTEIVPVARCCKFWGLSWLYCIFGDLQCVATVMAGAMSSVLRETGVWKRLMSRGNMIHVWSCVNWWLQSTQTPPHPPLWATVPEEEEFPSRVTSRAGPLLCCHFWPQTGTFTPLSGPRDLLWNRGVYFWGSALSRAAQVRAFPSLMSEF